MPRTYIRRTDRGLVPDNVWREAVNRVVAGESTKSVAKDLDLPRTSLRRKVDLLKKNESAEVGSAYGKSTVFPLDAEKTLADYLEQSSKMFHGLSTKSARQMAFHLATINNLKMPQSWKDNGEAGRDWLRSFLKRHSRLSIRRPEATSLARVTSFNRHNVKEFFDILETLYLSLNIDGSRIFNLDESGFTTVQKMPKVIAPKGMKQVGQVTSRERGELVTVCGIISALGVALPPVFIFPRKKFQAHMLNKAPEGSLGLVTDSGWMTGDKFLTVLEHFVKFAKPSKDSPVILILDNHESHLNLPALLYARENNIHIVTLVPHTSNKTQPLDRTVFGPVKAYFNERATSWMVANPGKTLTIYNIAELVGYAWIRGARPENIISGFRASGVWPLDRNVFPDEYFAPSDVTDRPVEASVNSQLPSAEPTASTSPSTLSQLSTSAPTSSSQASTSASTSLPQSSTSASTSTSQLSTSAPTSSPQSSTSASTSSPQVSTSDDQNEDFIIATQQGVAPSFISPQMCMGFPKAPPRSENTRGRKRGKCMVATASPHMKALQQKETEKSAKKCKKAKSCKKTLVFNDDSDSSSDEEVQLDNDSDGSYESDNDEDHHQNDITLGTVSDVSVGDFVLCQYDSKRTRPVFYVGIITKEVDDDFDVEVEFLRKNPKMMGKFVKPNVPELVAVPIDQLKAKLTRAKISGTTARTQNVFFFRENLDSLNMG